MSKVILVVQPLKIMYNKNTFCLGGLIVATKIEKRKDRRIRQAHEQGIDYEEVKEEKKNPEKMTLKKRFLKRHSELYWKWALFFINILLIMFILKFGVKN